MHDRALKMWVATACGIDTENISHKIEWKVEEYTKNDKTGLCTGWRSGDIRNTKAIYKKLKPLVSFE